MKMEAKALHTLTNGTEATVFLYGAIGLQSEPDSDSIITALSVRKTLDELVSNGATTIHARINSPGGLVGEAAAIVTAFTECKAAVHTWNDGRAYSAAADIWASGKVRHMAKNATMMIHVARGAVMGTPSAMKSYNSMLTKVSEATCGTIAKAMNTDFDKVWLRFYEDEKDHFLTYAEVEALNLLTPETTEYEAEALSVEVYEAEKSRIEQAYTQVVMFGNTVITITEKNEAKAMNAETLKTALAENTITLAEAEAIIAAEKAKQPLTIEAVAQMFDAKMQPIQAENDALKAEINALKSRTAATPPTTEAGTGEGANDPDAATKSDAEMAFEARNADLIKQIKAGSI